jgi:hypothetical protein
VLIAIKRKFIIIYLLNVSDIIVTLLLLQTGVFVEGNVFMRGIVESRTVSFIFKIGFPLLLLYIIYKRISTATEKQLAVGNTLINGCLIFYALINISHLVWIILYNTYFF